MGPVVAALALACAVAAARCDEAKPVCSECASSKDAVARGGAELEEMSEARREFYHGLILHKLNVTVPRNWSAAAARRTLALAGWHNMPDSLLASHSFLPQDTPVDRRLNDFYAETKQYMLHALDASAECRLASSRQRLCMSFDFKSVSAQDTIVAAKLYVWARGVSQAMSRRGGGGGGGGDGLLQVRQLTQHLRPGAVVTESPVPKLDGNGGAPETAGSSNDSGWLYFDLRKDAVRSWFGVGGGGVRLELSCKDCAPYSSSAPPLSVDFGEHRPFVLIDVERPDEELLRRAKRQGGSGSGTKLYCDEVPAGQQACCIERLQVLFSEFYPYIWHPKDFYPNYCRGSCSGFGQQIAYPNTNIVRSKLQSKRSPYMPCCVPTRMASIDVLYISDDGQTMQMKAMPNMVVEECGCM